MRTRSRMRTLTHNSNFGPGVWHKLFCFPIGALKCRLLNNFDRGTTLFGLEATGILTMEAKSQKEFEWVLRFRNSSFRSSHITNARLVNVRR